MRRKVIGHQLQCYEQRWYYCLILTCGHFEYQKRAKRRDGTLAPVKKFTKCPQCWEERA